MTPMRKVVIAPAAEQDIESILSWTYEHFGEQSLLRYESLLKQALLDIAVDSDVVGSILRPEIGASICTYHLAYSRHHVPHESGKVKHPRHFLLYRIKKNVIEVGRILHDSMDLRQHIPESFGAD